jgi:inositol hexakisphosphate/diphosphoinositol-pentakisphosphate kinase
MKNILVLMKDVIKNIQRFLTDEKDSWTYFITNKTQIEKRECDYYKKTQDNLISKILGEDKKEIKEKMNNKEDINKENKERKKSVNNNQKKGLSSSEDKKININIIENKKKMENIKKDANNEINFDCQDENIVLIYKRYVKLKNDFFNNKKNKFDVSKIPDIYDNIKYDIIHNKELMNNSAYELFDEVSLLANFVMPFEYGITRDEKIKIGLKIIKPLLNKIWSNLIDINSSSYSKEDNNWSGLDATKMNENEIKTPERHVKSRFYFTCASHMYALINIIGYGYNSILTHNNKKSFEELKKIFDFDYCSHIIFRLFEDLKVDLQNPKRFRLEIIMSPGSNNNPREANDEHLINVAPWIFLNKKLSLKQMKKFLSKFN